MDSRALFIVFCIRLLEKKSNYLFAYNFHKTLLFLNFNEREISQDSGKKWIINWKRRRLIFFFFSDLIKNFILVFNHKSFGLFFNRKNFLKKNFDPTKLRIRPFTNLSLLQDLVWLTGLLDQRKWLEFWETFSFHLFFHIKSKYWRQINQFLQDIKSRYL